MKYVTTIDDRQFVVDILDDHHVLVDGVKYEMNFIPVGSQPVFSLILDGHSYDAHVSQEDHLWQILVQGQMYYALVEDEREKRLRSSMEGMVAGHDEFHLKAPMPGLVVSVLVHDGQVVEKGDVLVILESMKMQNELRSPRPGTVARLRVAPGDRVEKKDTLLSVV